VKTRIQVKRLPKGVPDTPLLLTMYRLAQHEGMRAFYKGLGTTMLVRGLIRIDGFINLTSRVTFPTRRSTLVPTNGLDNNTPQHYHTRL
jgi:hypothetical protein